MEQPTTPSPAAIPTHPAPLPALTPAAPATPAATATTIQYDDFAKLDLRVGTIVEAKPAPKGDRLLVLQVELGPDRRQILAGIRQHYSPEQLIGKQIIIVANLAPRTMMGLTSQGMLLAATDPTTGRVIIAAPTEQVAAGSKVS
jgi:methionyl-tRNA synthetase